MTSVTSSNDEKLEHMKVKITKQYNVEDVQAEVIDKSSIKCASCKVVVKLGSHTIFTTLRNIVKGAKKYIQKGHSPSLLFSWL